MNFIPHVLTACSLHGSIHAQHDSEASTPANQPNIIIILTDDQGYSDTGCYGCKDFKTPHIDALAASGVKFTNGYVSHPYCSPSRAGLLTGRYQQSFGHEHNPPHYDENDLKIGTDLSIPLLPTYFTAKGYRTAAFGKWHIGGNDPNNYSHPKDSGVPYYEGLFTSQVDDYYSWTKVNSDGVEEQVNEYVTTHLTNSAISWIDNQTKPWFLWLAHVAPHAPFQTPPSGTYTTTPTNTRTTYLSMIENMDYEINRLLESMDDETLENTVIIFIGDNGTPGAANNYWPNGHAKSSMYEGGIRVPMIITGKSVERVNEVEASLVQATDLHATILELAGVQVLGGTDNSFSLKPALSYENQVLNRINSTLRLTLLLEDTFG